MNQVVSEVKNHSLSARFARGAFWSLVGTVGARLSAFIGAVITARFLGQVGFGELAMIQTTIGMLGTFAGLGIGMTATRYVAELRLKDPERTGRIIALTYLTSWTAGGLMALCCFLAAPWLAIHTLNAPHLVPEIRLASLLLLVSAGFGPQGNILTGFQAFRAIARINWWQGLLSLPITVFLVWWAGLRGVVWALIISALLGAGLYAQALFREYRHSHAHLDFFKAWVERAVLWRFSLPAFLSSIIYVPTLWAANAILANQPNGYAELGVFNVAMQFQWMITGLSTIFAPVSISLLAEMHGNNDPSRYAHVATKNLQLNGGLAIILAFLTLILSPWLIKIFGRDFLQAGPVVPLALCSSAIYVCCRLTYQSVFGSGLMWYNCLVAILWGGTVLCLEKFIFVEQGAWGLAFAFLVAHLMRFSCDLLFLSRKGIIIFNRTLSTFCLLIFYGFLSIFINKLTNGNKLLALSSFGIISFILSFFILYEHFSSYVFQKGSLKNIFK